MTFALPTLGLFIALGCLIGLTLGTGCTSKKEEPLPSTMATRSPSVLDVSPAPAAPSTPAPAPQHASIVLPTDPIDPPAGSLASEPVKTRTPLLALAPDTSAAAPPETGGTSYTVKKGDTLFKIAKDHYGNGKQWSRIASANPGLTPANLRAGQKIVVP